MQKTLLFSLLAATVTSKACACTRGDIICLAKCYDLPDPTEEQTLKTNQCITSCTESDANDTCFEKCIKQIYKVHESDRSASQKPTATPTTVAKDSKSTSTDEPTSTKKDSTKSTSTTTEEKSTTKPKTTTSASSKSSSSVAPVAPIGTNNGISSASFSVILAAMSVASYLTL